MHGVVIPEGQRQAQSNEAEYGYQPNEIYQCFPVREYILRIGDRDTKLRTVLVREVAGQLYLVRNSEAYLKRDDWAPMDDAMAKRVREKIAMQGQPVDANKAFSLPADDRIKDL